MATQAPLPPGSDWIRILEWVLSFLGGVIVTIVATRTKLAMMTRDVEDAKTEAKEAKALATSLAGTVETLLDRRLERLSDDLGREFKAMQSHVSRIDRRTYEMLRIIADVARISNADQRLGDSLLRMLNDYPPLGESDTRIPTSRDL